ncbi:MAG: hypothetical protein ACOYNZ_08085 [Rhodoferax sp.]
MKVGSFAFTAPHKLASARLVDGDKAKVLKTRGVSFEVPVAAKSWSIDALIEFEYATPQGMPLLQPWRDSVPGLSWNRSLIVLAVVAIQSLLLSLLWQALHHRPQS